VAIEALVVEHVRRLGALLVEGPLRASATLSVVSGNGAHVVALARRIVGIRLAGLGQPLDRLGQTRVGRGIGDLGQARLVGDRNRDLGGT
jgi:hypothetical protein